MKQAESLQDIVGYDTRYNTVRVNNCVLTATAMGLKTRSKRETIEKALEGLPRDPDGKPVLDDPIPYRYDLVANNCEYFATRCRYYCDGFSMQV